MAYATQQDMIDRFSTEELVAVTDRDTPQTGAIVSVVLNKALGDADAMINGYVSKQYDLPLVPIPEILTRIACDVARFFLHKDSPPDYVTEAYKVARDQLKDISKGILVLTVDDSSVPEEITNQVLVESEAPVFTSDSLKDY